MTVVALPSQRGATLSRALGLSHSSGIKRSQPHGAGMYARHLLPDDPVGTVTVTFSGIPAGAEIRVFNASTGLEVAGIESCLADQTLSWPAYVPGNINNVLRFVIVSAAYKIKEFTYVASAGFASIPSELDRDPWYYNPT